MRKFPALALIGIVGVLALAGGLVWFYLREQPSPPETQRPQENLKSPADVTPRLAPPRRSSSAGSTIREVSAWETNSTPKSTAPARTAKTQATATYVPPPIPSANAQPNSAMTRLLQLTSTRTPIGRAQASEINGLLAQLAKEGQSAIPAIRAFLEQNQDFSFDGIEGGQFVNYSTLRLGILDVLQQIGGTEAVQVSVATLQATADPLEIAYLSAYLESQQPGQYRQLELTAAQEALAQAARGQIPGRDMSALFELLQAYGTPDVVGDLEKAVARWNYYATLALAGLPNGAGIPTLIKLSQDSALAVMGNGDFALRPLAQVAMLYPEAAQALIDNARQNRIPDKAWATVSASLAGSYIQYGNQIFGSTSPPMTWSVDQINKRISLINQMLTVTSSATGRQALQGALASLTARLPK